MVTWKGKSIILSPLFFLFRTYSCTCRLAEVACLAGFSQTDDVIAAAATFVCLKELVSIVPPYDSPRHCMVPRWHSLTQKHGLPLLQQIYSTLLSLHSNHSSHLRKHLKGNKHQLRHSHFNTIKISSGHHFLAFYQINLPFLNISFCT